MLNINDRTTHESFIALIVGNSNEKWLQIMVYFIASKHFAANTGLPCRRLDNARIILHKIIVYFLLYFC